LFIGSLNKKVPHETIFSLGDAPEKKPNHGKKSFIKLLFSFLSQSGDIQDSEFLRALENSSQCTPKSKMCILSEGAYGRAYKLDDGENSLVVKLPLDKGFDKIEMELNIQAYKACKQFPINPIVEALGFWRSPTLQSISKTNNFAFVYKYEDSYSTYAELIRRTQLSTEDFKSLAFQMCVVLHTLQTKLPGFCHNDVHGYNILIKKTSTRFSFANKDYEGSYYLKLLDFGMSQTRAKCTRDAQRIWQVTKYNPFVDFLTFCNHTLIYASAYAKKNNKYPVWLAEFLRFVGKHFHPQCVKNGKGTGAWLHYKYLYIDHDDGLKYINSKPNSLLSILKDPYFD
jgi:hypothetical protein